MPREDPLPDLLPPRVLDWLSILADEVSVTMLSCVYWREDPSWSVPRRRIFDSFMLIPTRGAVRVTLDGGRHLLSPGQILLLSDGVPHALDVAPGHAALEQVSLHCHLTSATRPPLLSAFTHPIQSLPHADYHHARLRQLTCCMQRPTLRQPEGERLVRDLLADLLMAGAQLRSPKLDLDPRIATALQTIHTAYRSELTVEHLARTASLSTVQFRKLFLRYLHASPKHYLQQHRLRLAARHLRATQRPVKQIADDVGFHTEAYFHRCFRAAYRCTPLDYRAGRRQPL